MKFTVTFGSPAPIVNTFVAASNPIVKSTATFQVASGYIGADAVPATPREIVAVFPLPDHAAFAVVTLTWYSASGIPVRGTGTVGCEACRVSSFGWFSERI